MSGGHFDYQQYHIKDIADSIEREIEEATKPKPPKVWKEDVTVFKKNRRLAFQGYLHGL